ncbi:MAG: hypothetical protein M3O61_07275 [Gemmatimonadota bacterium]|nr:hypothetical protein [Gemmatimonadota bacterium]
MGETILRSHDLPAHSLASYTAATEPMVAHGWLSEVIFALLYRAGGLPLLAILTAIIVAATHAAVLLFLKRKGVDARWALAAAFVSFALGLSHWLTRPHMFSIVGSALTLFLLESARPRRAFLFFGLFALWANLHGAWLYGLLLIGAYIAGDLAEALAGANRSEWLKRARSDSVLLVAGTAGTFVNPYGIGLHREVFSAVTSSSLATKIEEYLPPKFNELASLPFLLVVLLTLVLFSVTQRRMPFRWLGVVVLSLFFGLRSFRNIALFGVTAWPLIALHTGRTWPEARRRFPYFHDFVRLDARASVGWWSAPVALALVALGLSHGRIAGKEVIADRFDPGKFPVVAVDSARRAGLSGRVFSQWTWGGYLLLAWPGIPLHVDPLKFSDTTIATFTRIDEVQPEWKAELDRWNVQTVMVKSKGTLAKALAKEPAWRMWYQDTTATVFRRSGVPAAGPPVILHERPTSTTPPANIDSADDAPRD